MTRRKVVLAEIGRHSGHLSGPLGAIWLAVQITGTPAMKCARDSSKVSVPLTHLDDVLCHLEYTQKRHVEVVQAVSLDVD